ncbi:hypothetical protein [Rhodococcus kronopolitis]|uniref:Uncharacterized protein n=1 Tax=Rhodococcus kronopolitis TaxID=1460226 RepID=A0ABV9FWE7_9NOCA
MAFEVKSTHRVASTGGAACEVYPNIFIDNSGRAFTTDAAVVADEGAVTRLAADATTAFLVDDAAVELAVNWIQVDSGDRMAPWRLAEREKRRWAHAVPLPRLRSDVDWASVRWEERTVAFEVRATHRVRATRALACEVYPDVFIVKRGNVISRRAGMAMQQPGDIVGELPADSDEWFAVRDGTMRDAVNWVSTIAGFRDDFWTEQHGGRSGFHDPVGPMGPSRPPRRSASD